MSNKALCFILKILALAISVFIFAWLLPMSGSISDKWFSTWLQGTIASAFGIVLFVCWIIETIVNWDK